MVTPRFPDVAIPNEPLWIVRRESGCIRNGEERSDPMPYFDYAMRQVVSRLFKAAGDACCALIHRKDNPGRTVQDRAESERGFLVAQSRYIVPGNGQERCFAAAR